MNDDALETSLGPDRWLAGVTASGVREALDDFKLELAPGKDFDWVARAVCQSLIVADIHNDVDPEERVSNLAIQEHLNKISDLTHDAHNYLQQNLPGGFSLSFRRS